MIRFKPKLDPKKASGQPTDGCHGGKSSSIAGYRGYSPDVLDYRFNQRGMLAEEAVSSRASDPPADGGMS